MATDGASALETFVRQLEAMTARYRIGDGTGGTFVGAANNCSQDSNRALFATLRRSSDTWKPIRRSRNGYSNRPPSSRDSAP